MAWILLAQDLGEDIPRSRFIEAGHLDKGLELLTPDDNANAMFSEDLQIVNSIGSNQIYQLERDIRNKEEQLGLILRRAYYQKISTPRWASILSTESWRESFLKWRYFAQLVDYVRDSAAELIDKKNNFDNHRGGKNEHIALKETNTENQQETYLVSEGQNDDNQDEASGEEHSNVVEVELVTTPVKEEEIDSEETHIEESAPNLEEFIFNFSLVDLTLADSIFSEFSSIEADTATELVNIEIEEVDQSVVEDEVPGLEIEESEVKKDDEVIAVSENTKDLLQEANSLKIKIESTPKIDDIIKVEDKKSTTVGEERDVVTGPSESEIVSKPPPLVSNPAESATAKGRTSINMEFAGRRGQIIWPINGRITDRYGVRRNAAARGLRPENYGIDMVGSSGGSVKAVYEGTVLMAVRQAPYDYIVTVKHGDYTTAYYFLDKVNVQVGDVITAGHHLGSLRLENNAPFHFEIWREQERMNPEPWLISR